MGSLLRYLTKIFKDIIVKVVSLVTYMHGRILGINDSNELFLSDKELHFYTVAVFGVILLFCLYPLFRYMVKRNKTLLITWIFVFVFLVGFTLLIEVGQKLTGTGDMDYLDTVAGLMGFIVASVVLLIVREIWLLIRLLFNKGKKNSD
ncbi:MAG: hypothetical protein ACI32B_05045 [Erysipelotrichaceae bacterium]